MARRQDILNLVHEPPLVLITIEWIMTIGLILPLVRLPNSCGTWKAHRTDIQHTADHTRPKKRSFSLPCLP